MQSDDECFRTMPKRLKIGAYDWAIRIVAEPHPELCGLADPECRVISLWPLNLTSHDHAVGIALHEALHVIFENQGLENLKRGKEGREEQIILAFEAGLVSLFRDNPRFMRWLGKWLSSRDTPKRRGRDA